MKGQRSPVHDNQQRVQSLDTVYAVGKYHGAAGILEQKVIQVEVLLFLLTKDSGLSQGLHSCLLPGQVNDFGFGPDPHFLHENFQLAPLVQMLPLLLLQKAGGQAAIHGQCGREHERLPLGIELNGVQHLQKTPQLRKVASLHHAIGFIDDQAPVEQHNKGKSKGSMKNNQIISVKDQHQIHIHHTDYS